MLAGAPLHLRQLATREAARLEREEMERDRREVYERWDTAVKASDVETGDGGGGASGGGGGGGGSDGAETQSVEDADILSVDERLRAAKSEAQELLKSAAAFVDVAETTLDETSAEATVDETSAETTVGETSAEERPWGATSEAATLLGANAGLKATGNTNEEKKRQK